MGSKKRAIQLSEKLGMSLGVKKWLKFLLDKCGNCPYRLVCWSQLFEDKGLLIEKYREVFYCDGKYKGHAKKSFDGKQVVKFIQQCDGCYYLQHCIANVLQAKEFIGMIEATSDNPIDHVNAVKRCSACPDNERCWSGILKDIKFGWKSSPKIIKIMMMCKFRKEGE